MNVNANVKMNATPPPEDAYRPMDDIERELPASAARFTLITVALLFVILLVWSAVGRLDIIASAEGRLMPQSFVKIVQPADAGIVLDIRVKENQRVEAGQILMRMDTQASDADSKTLQTELTLKSLQLRRVAAELAGRPLSRQGGDPPDLLRQVEAQYRDRRQNYLDAQGQELESLNKAQHEHAAAREILTKLRQSVPMLKHQAEAYADLGKDGYAALLTVQDKEREYLERAQDLHAQEATVASLEAAMAQSRKRLDQITSGYRKDLRNEHIETEGAYQKLHQDWTKLRHKAALLELKAPQAGIVKDLAIHTPGTVVAPGTILLTLVPEHEPLVAEVQIKNDDVGFVIPQQEVKIKLAAYPFQKYGMLAGKVIQIGPDAQDAQAQTPPQANSQSKPQVTTYKALIGLNSQELEAQGGKFKLVPGMQVTAEIHQGRRTVLEYLLSPVQKTLHESAQER